jgi:hypothetical protein
VTEAAVKMERLVNVHTEETVSEKELEEKFVEMENALERALDAVQTLGLTAEKKTIENGENALTSVPPELTKEVTDRINAAAEIGDVMQIKSLAERLMSESDAVAPFCDKLVQLAEDLEK